MAPKLVSVTVKFSKSGMQPPLFLAGSFSEPAWQPQEMQYTTNAAGEHEFHKEVEVEEGIAYQYKFRVGEGDWWMLNEDSPTVTDDVGNRNNLLSLPVSEELSAEQQNSENPHAAEETASHSAEMERPKSEPVHDAPIDTKDEQVETPDEKAELPEAEDHHTITPAHTNTPAGERVEDEEEEASAAEGVEIPKEVQLNGEPLSEETSASPAAEDDNAKAQHIADSIGLLHHTDGTQEEESKPSETLLAPSPPGTIEPTSTPAVQGVSAETVSSPPLSIEKVDDELRHEDESKDGFKETLPIRSVIPDHVFSRAETRTPELADTAAEVSESAALLDRDRDPPTPPMSDEEAGRIGYRRMSSTPIPEVAKTAAEVADVAAKLDEQHVLAIEIAPNVATLTGDDEEDPLDSGASTPESQKAPRFSYECLGEPDIGVPALPTHREPPIDPLEPVRSPYEEPTVIDWNDPSIEMFPTDRAAIIHTIRRLSERLPEDVPDLDIVPPSPVIGPNGQYFERQSPLPSPAINAHQVSPSLDSITEEHDEHQEALTSMPAVSKLSSIHSDKENAVLSQDLNEGHAELDAIEQPKLDGTQETTEHDPARFADAESEEIAGQPIIVIEEPVLETKDEEDTPTDTPGNEVAEDSHEPQLASISQDKVEETPVEKAEELPNIEQPQQSSKPELTLTNDQGEVTTSSAEEISSEVKEVAAEEDSLPVQQSLDAKPRMPSRATPFVVGNRQLGHDDSEIEEIATGIDFPNITIQPATPATMKTEFVPKPLDTAKSTAVEEENGRQVTSRKPRSQSPERPVTPSSMRSATRDAKTKNFLKAFWRVVFVDWIGGLFRALCGGRGGYT